MATRFAGTKRFLLSLAPILCVNEFVLSVTPVNGKSMTPTLNPDTMRYDERDWVLLDKLSVTRGNIIHNDVVTFTAPHDPDMTLIKRIIALEGDIDKNIKFDPPPRVVKVPKGHVWVESDESYRGIDSNLFGPIPVGLLQARCKYIVWPPERMGPVADGNLRRGVEYVY
ncbi:LexA/Signal peptidase [Rhizoclosmatium globosum]|uniref:Mitochondrial inner membrane protease subunit n=1 Tax=Rhizoclosmatium globosum TaxID=329046 RepID=A0A1Y2CHF0_9FUNG|nr:LexA/Signal peptidase [Rhizoclosmatium globosum]|eukprot:ORY46337.1 LexA/Signal peptidase [Rhizoclosmatium globosum]